VSTLAAEKLQNWHIEAAEAMARTGCTLKEAAGLLDQVVTSEECDRIIKRKSFQKVLWEARHRYFTQLGQSSELKKDTMIGRMINLAEKLESADENDKAAEVWFKVGKALGWVGPENTVTVFGELSQHDLDEIRRKVEDAAKTARPN